MNIDEGPEGEKLDKSKEMDLIEDKEKAHAIILFVDFSSAFNALQPHLLLKRHI